jgi:hypothetical protein
MHCPGRQVLMPMEVIDKLLAVAELNPARL